MPGDVQPPWNPSWFTRTKDYQSPGFLCNRCPCLSSIGKCGSKCQHIGEAPEQFNKAHDQCPLNQVLPTHGEWQVRLRPARLIRNGDIR